MPETECIVCQRMFEKELVVSLKLDEEYLLQKAEDMICSDECWEIYRETWINKKEFCFKCGKKVDEGESVAWQDDYKKMEVHPICQVCLPDVPTEREVIEMGDGVDLN